MSFKHISARVPWHDNGWNGTVCKNPKANASCLTLQNIRTKRDENELEEYKGSSIQDLPKEKWPPCVREKATFMAPFEHSIEIKHPYKNGYNKQYENLKDTNLRIPPYSAPLVPFRWMNKEYAQDLAEQKGFVYDEKFEPKFKGFNSSWVNGYKNQKSILNRFVEDIHPEQSLCVFYAKDTPLTEENRRVVVGVGRVLSVKDPKEYDVEDPNKFTSFIWEMPMQHSIRPDFKDGFILPYQEILELAENDEEINPEEYAVFAPADRRMEFSYGSEHVTHDATIDVLLECKRNIEQFKSLVDGPWNSVLQWIDDRLSELWKLRGPYPGLGPALKAFGIAHGGFLAYEISKQLDENEDPWPYVDNILQDPSKADERIQKYIKPTITRTWQNNKANKPERLKLLKLISRFEVTDEQAKRFFDQTERAEKGIECSDKEILNNPYLLYEEDRFSLDNISFFTVDRGIYPESAVRDNHPLPIERQFNDESHPFRIRAMLCYQLEREAEQGHTLQSRDKIISDLSGYNLAIKCPINNDILDAIQDDLSPKMDLISLPGDNKAYQLKRYKDIGSNINTEITKRLKGKPHEIDVDWQSHLENVLDISLSEDNLTEKAAKAKDEKLAALRTIAKSRFSVLMGAAGTGKTTLLQVLCSSEKIRNRGILLLAPTGKARIQLQKGTNIKAQTIAQFLLQQNRYDVETGRYHLSDEPSYDEAKTVIIDESSMLTEDQLGALLDGLRGVERLILVGDPYQLPPIGAGKPFYDIVSYIKEEDDIQHRFPRVKDGFVELTIKHRQINKEKDEEFKDLQLAEWFCDQQGGPGDDEILAELYDQQDFERLRFVKWDDMDDFEEKLLSILYEELDEMSSVDDEKGFAKSLGAIESEKGNTYFNKSAAKAIENWQILTPNRNNYYGVTEVNRSIQKRFRGRVTEWARSRKSTYTVINPVGPEELTYGDKVYNVKNHYRGNIYPKDDDALKYIANGEIGILTGQMKSPRKKGKPRYVHVVFSSQPDHTYSFFPNEFNDESSPPLELAYALTVHKSQGSGFGKTFLILPTKSHLVSRELLYTALTRQREKVVVLHQMELADIIAKSDDRYSEAKKRLTNLFTAPNLVELADDTFLDEHLINRTTKGQLVRSKSEAIIGIILEKEGIHYEYEQPLQGTDDKKRFPDFTIEDAATGETYYWEHCGMLTDPEYKARWQRKKKWYRDQDILPFEEGGGSRGTLVVTEDKPDGGIESDAIEAVINEVIK